MGDGQTNNNEQTKSECPTMATISIGWFCR